ncbi:MAG: sodium/glutamate symporter [Planctomycetota bacterium]|nr:sodium/glutamate symporter [Planctomycetota bacterium]
MQHAFLIACALLLIGFIYRVHFRFLQVLYIPASVIGGLVGLILGPYVLGPRLVESIPIIANTYNALLPAEAFEILSKWPGWLIAVVFAGLYMEKPARSFKESAKLATREGIMVWIIVLGQMTIGIIACWFLIKPFYEEVPYSFGQLIETGFAGGHGTAAAMGQVFKSIGFEDGHDLGIFMATVGLVYSVVSGIVLVNLAVRRGWTRAGDVQIPIVQGMESRSGEEPAAYEKVRPEVIDPIVFQALILAAAFGIGFLLSNIVNWWVPQIEEALLVIATGERMQSFIPDMAEKVKELPFFIYTLAGGLIVREGMHALKIDDLIDIHSIRRLTSAAMEFLIVSAIATLRIEAVIKMIVPLTILLVVAFIWCAVCLLWIGRRLLPPEYWFELGIINYGMSTGTTATGFMLLRIVDKDLDSGAAEDYALAAPLSAPFIGGGLLTLAMPLILEGAGVAVPALILVIAMVALFFTGVKLSGR